MRGIRLAPGERGRQRLGHAGWFGTAAGTAVTGHLRARRAPPAAEVLPAATGPGGVMRRIRDNRDMQIDISTVEGSRSR
jgi:hypothetical protein